VLEAQQAAQRQLLKEKMLRPVEDDDEPDIRALDRVIENLEAAGTKVPAPLPMPTAGRSGDTGGPVTVDKYGYVIRSAAPPPINNMAGSQMNPMPVMANPIMTNPTMANTNPMDYYKSMFTDAPAIPPQQRSGFSLDRDSFRPGDLSRKTRTKSRSRSPIRRRSRSSRRRSKSREKSRRRSRTRSRSRDRRRDRERRRNGDPGALEGGQKVGTGQNLGERTRRRRSLGTGSGNGKGEPRPTVVPLCRRS